MGQRKQRSDKKKEVRPYVSPELKEMIETLSDITQTPIKDISEFMCLYLISNPNAINELSKYFQHDIRLGNIVYYGFIDNPSIAKKASTDTERVTIRFKQADYQMLSIVSYALDSNVTRVTAVLLEIAFSSMELTNYYVKNYLKEELTSAEMKELRNILSELNNSKEHSSSWLSLVLSIISEVSTPIVKTKEAIGEFLQNVRRYDD